ncbi:MAG: cobyrinate a,c-diamide synthase [Desulfovibrio sp.]
MTHSRIVFSGLSGGAGKTIVSLGISRAWCRQGKLLRPFKKGPDYIDAMWLSLAANAPTSNLDPFLLSQEQVCALFNERAAGYDISVIEGNRGLFDGKDVTGSCSTAELARQLDAPVVLILDCTKMTRTVAAVVAGCASFEKDLNLAGVILNQTATDRHRAILRDAIEQYTDVPVLGMLPRMKKNPIPERHMGLVSDQEYFSEGAGNSTEDKALNYLADFMEDNVDLARVYSIACDVKPVSNPPISLWPEPVTDKPVTIGYVHDAALWFYYSENLDALKSAGAELVQLSLLDDEPWPELDGLYLGGGFPETLARELADNTAVLKRVRELAESGLPIYAECGGFLYLTESIEYGGRTYPMAGVFPVQTKFKTRPQGLGYTCAEVVMDTPFYKAGTELHGHEFHYTYCEKSEDADLCFTVELSRGKGVSKGKDGLVYKNTFAGYNHIHALGAPEWAPAVISAALKFRDTKERK